MKNLRKNHENMETRKSLNALYIILICIITGISISCQTDGQTSAKLVIKIEEGQTYLNFPVNNSDPLKRVTIRLGEIPLDRFTINLAEEEPEFWTFFATGSPIRNYHLRFHPKEHLRRFTQLKINQIQDLAKALKLIFFALDTLEINRNRNILFNCCPYGYDANFHIFGDIIPHEIIGGAEMADDMRVARKLPEDVANEIRNVIQHKFIL